MYFEKKNYLDTLFLKDDTKKVAKTKFQQTEVKYVKSKKKSNLICIT